LTTFDRKGVFSFGLEQLQMAKWNAEKANVSQVALTEEANDEVKRCVWNPKRIGRSQVALQAWQKAK